MLSEKFESVVSLASQFYVLTVDPTKVLPEYMALFMNSPIGRAITESLQTGSSGQQHLYPAHLSEILIPLPRIASGAPDLEEQSRVVSLAIEANDADAYAKDAARRLDEVFLEIVGGQVDLGTIPI